jgi:hypothetical protein
VEISVAFGVFVVSNPFRLIACMDESGTHDATGKQPGSDVAAICGYVSTYKRWVQFQKKWRKVLKRYDISALHMKKFAHRVGEFEGWSEEKRRSLIAAAAAAIENASCSGWAESFQLLIMFVCCPIGPKLKLSIRSTLL